jgi:hypothetical protein
MHAAGQIDSRRFALAHFGQALPGREAHSARWPPFPRPRQPEHFTHQAARRGSQAFSIKDQKRSGARSFGLGEERLSLCCHGAVSFVRLLCQSAQDGGDGRIVSSELGQQFVAQPISRESEVLVRAILAIVLPFIVKVRQYLGARNAKQRSKERNVRHQRPARRDAAQPL